MALEREVSFYRAHRDEYLKSYPNLFVLINGDELIGVYPDAETAHREGVNKFGMEPFLVKQVSEVEPVTVCSAALVASARL